MAREIVIHVYCDVCLKELDTKTDAPYTETVTVGRLTRELSLCEVHEDEIMAPITRAIMTYGLTPDALPTQVDAGADNVPPCPMCGFITKSKTPRARLAAHMRDAHDTDINEYLPGFIRRRATTVILPRPTPPPRESSFPCPYCDRVLGAKVARLSHVRSSHSDHYDVFKLAG